MKGQWEYKIVLNPTEFLAKMENELNELGNERWDLTYATVMKSGETELLMGIMKREKREDMLPRDDFSTQELRPDLL